MAVHKGKNDRETRLLKNFITNQLVFFELFHKDDFHRRLVRLSVRYFPTDSPQEKFSGIGANTFWCFSNRSKLRKISREFVDLLEPEPQINFYMTVHKLLKDYRLTSQWLSAIVDFATIGFVLPPVFNLGMSQEVILPTDDELRKGKSGWVRRARATLILNPDTTLGDIQDAWPEIRQHQKASWPGYKGYKLSPKTIIRDAEVREVEKAKKEISDEVKYASLSDYEKARAKKFEGNSAAARRAVAQYRRLSGKKPGRIKIKRKLTDMDIVKRKGFKGAAAKRAAATLRQRRHRSKNVTPFLR